MTFTVEQELLEFLEKRKNKVLAVEIAGSSGSDFEVSELHIRTVSEKQAERMIRLNGCHPRETTEGIKVLLPNYRLEYADTITFGLKKILCFHVVTCRGITL